MKQWTSEELAVLRRLRERFLSSDSTAPDYWQSQDDLALYDATFGERISWKWDAVLSELDARGWQPRSRHLVDFGCGSGVAGRRVADHWPGHFSAVTLHDRSRLALIYASGPLRQDHPEIEVRTLESVDALPPDTLLVLSHVLNELPPAALGQVLALARGAREILWVEAGTHADSRRLITEVREPLLSDGVFVTVAPCTHQARCGMLAPENARHWCHFFAPVPSDVFQSARWAEFAREIGIDLRVLPYSFLALQRTASELPTAPERSRVIGHPRDYKGYSKVLSCQAEGVTEYTLQKRDARQLLREIRDAVSPYRWTIRNGKIIAGERVSVGPAEKSDAPP